MVDVSLAFSLRSFDAILPAADLAQTSGLSRMWLTETPGRDAFARAAEAARHTTQLRVATGIAYAFTRHPVAVASAAIELNELSAGRFRLGLGVGPADFRTAMGVDFDHPASRLSEYIAVVRAALHAENGLDFDGPFYQIHLPAFASTVPVHKRSRIQVFGSGLTQVAIRAIARTADGIALHPLATTPHYLQSQVHAAIAQGRGEKPFTIAGWCITSVDTDPAAALTRARTRLALYLSVRGLEAVVKGTAWEDDVARLQAAAHSHAGANDWGALGQLLPENLVHELCVVSTPGELGERLSTRAGELEKAGVDELVIQVAAMSGSEQQLLEEVRHTLTGAGGLVGC